MSIILDGSTGITSDSSASNPAMTAKGNGSDVEGYIQLNCRVNSHGVKLKSPPHSSGQSYTMILPDNQVAADKFLKVKSITGSGSTAVGQLEYADASGGKFASYAIICDQKGSNVKGGSTSTGTFNTRDLNTELADADGIVSISSNQFTLQAGSYLIRANAPAHAALRHQIIVWNYTDSSITGVGTSEYGATSGATTTRSFVTCRTTISSAKAFEIRHRVGSAKSNDGFGVASDYDAQPCIYTIVEIYKEA